MLTISLSSPKKRDSDHHRNDTYEIEFALESALDEPPAADVFSRAYKPGRGGGDVLILDPITADPAEHNGGVPTDVVRAADGQSTYGTNAGQTYSLLGLSMVSPLLLDLDRNGKPDVSGGSGLSDGRFDWTRVALFDWAGNGVPDLSEWIGPSDGLLCRPNRANQCDVGSLFGTHGGFRDGYAALAQLDRDDNGLVERAELAGIAVWQDRNGDAITDASELLALADIGLSAIAVDHTDYASIALINHDIMKTWDWWPTTLRTRPNRSRP